LLWFRIGTSGGFFEHGNEPSGSVKCGKFLEQLRKFEVLFDVRVFYTCIHIQGKAIPIQALRVPDFMTVDT
jgi:hypothetical protein